MSEMKPISKTFIFTVLNKGGVVQAALSNLLENGTPILSDNPIILEQILNINKNFKFLLKPNVMKSFNDGEIRILINPSTPKSKRTMLPTSLPIFLSAENSSVIANISLDHYISKEVDTSGAPILKISPKTLYCLLEGAYIYRKLYNNKRLSSSVFYYGLSDVFADMLLKIFAKNYGTNLNQNTHGTLRFIISKYFLINLIGMNDTNAFNVAILNKANASEWSINNINDNFPVSAFSDINTFITELQKPEYALNLKDLNTRAFMESFILMYGSLNLLTLENLAYMLINLFAAKNGGFLNNQTLLVELINQNVVKTYRSFK